MAGNEVSDGELEDGEVLSSEEEGEGNTKVCVTVLVSKPYLA